MLGKCGWKVQRAVDGGGAGLDRLARLRALAVAATLGAEIDDHRARFHRRYLRRPDQLRRRPPRHGGRGDYHVGLGDVPAQHLLHALLFVGRQFAGIAALAGGIDTRVDKLRAERLRLLLGLGTHVIAFGDRAEPMGGRQRRQPAPPSPITSTVAARSEPTAVVIIGRIRGMFTAPSSGA